MARALPEPAGDQAIRAAAFAAVWQLSRRFDDHVPWEEIDRGFQAGGQHVRFASKAEGIFKPQRMSAALSIKTVFPKAGRRRWYSDQDSASTNLDSATGLLRYDLARARPASNEALRRAWQRGAHLIYFLGVEPGVYQPIFPVWIADFRTHDVLLATADFLAAGQPAPLPAAAIADAIPVSYSSTTARTRNHQAWFSARTKAAYRHRCAFSGLPVRELLVGAHIRPDAEGGPASVRNGICMSTLHHVAFDSHLLGVDPDHRIHVSPRLREDKDGELLAALTDLEGARLRLPDVDGDRPDPAHLEYRFRRFRERR